MKFKTQYISLESVCTGRNVRLPALMKIEELATDIHENGLQTPITVFERNKGEFLVIAGHRRVAACRKIFSEEPVHFKSLFPNGIPASVVSGITLAEAEAMKVDHGNEVGLQDPMEIQLCANLLFDQGFNEKQVVVRLASLMDRVKPMKADKAKKYNALLLDAELWKEKGNLRNYQEKVMEAQVFLFNYRRGYIQNLHHAYRCPDRVMAALWFKATGQAPEKDSGFYSSEALPVAITYEHVQKLSKAFAADLEILKDGVTVYSKAIPGPAFEAKWAEICKELGKKQTDSENQVIRPKAMSAGDMETELKEGKWKSGLAQLLTRYHRKETVDAEILKKLDKIAFYAEIIADRAPEEWSSVVALADSIITEQTAALQVANS